MKHITSFVGMAALLASGAVFAAGAGTLAGTDAVQPKVVTSAAGCTLLSTDVNLQISKNSVGAWDCSATYIGVAAASSAGKKQIFKGSSMGGKVAADTAHPCADTICTTSEAATVALAGSTGT